MKLKSTGNMHLADPETLTFKSSVTEVVQHKKWIDDKKVPRLFQDQ